MTADTTDPLDLIARKWMVDKSDPCQISIITDDNKLRVAHLCHSGFGISTEDHKTADHIVALHNATLHDR